MGVDKLISVAPTRRDWYGIKYAARFILEDGTLLPSESGTEHHVSLRIEGRTMDPRLQVFVEEVAFPISLEFRGRHTSNLVLNVDTSGEEAVLDLQLDFETCLAIGLTATTPYELVEKIREHMISTVSKFQLRLKIYFAPLESPEDLVADLKLFFHQPKLDDFDSQPEEAPRSKALPWYPYCGRRTLDPKTQYGQLITRATVQEMTESQEIMKIPASNHFYDLQEASIKLVYGAVLEHEISLIHLKSLSTVEHQITIFSVPESGVLLGAVMFKKLRNTYTPESMADSAAIVPDGTTCVVTVTDSRAGRSYQYSAVSVPKVFSLPVPCDLVLLLLPSGKSNTTLNNPFSTRGQPNKQYMCKLKFDTHSGSVRAQVIAINTLRQDRFRRWHPIMLNHDYAALPHVDVFTGLPEDQVQNAYEQVYAMKEWNAKQLQVFQMLRNVPGNGFAFVEGVFGCGKTLVQATLAKLLVDLEKHVLIVAPTNAAVHAMSETILKHIPDLDAVRVVFASGQATKKFGQQNDEHASPDNNDLAMFRLLKDMTAFRANVARSHDLLVHVDQLVEEMRHLEERVEFEYLPDRERIADLNANLDDEDGIQPDKYDAIAVYNEHKSTDFTAFPPEDGPERDDWMKNKDLFAKALETLQGKVISKTKLLLCTQQLASSKLIRQNFAVSDSKGMVIIADEDGQSLEPVAWIPIVLLKSCDHIQAILRFGDRLQLPPLAISATSNLSEFGRQMNRSLFDRHLRYHEPAVRLNMQYRMHPLLSKFPNFHTYGGALANGKATETIQVDEVFSKRLIEWARPHLPSSYTPDPDFSRLLGVNVLSSTVVTDEATSSRSNPKVAKVVSEMLSVAFKEQPYPRSTITIITPYNAQKALYLTMIRDIQQKTGLPFDQLPRVATIDSMQGHESDIVILDWVNQYGSDLGFLKDNRRANVALTRAHSALIVLFTCTSTASYDSDQDPSKRKRRRAGIPVRPEVLMHWDYLVKNGLDIHVEQEPDVDQATEEHQTDTEYATEQAGTWGEEQGEEDCAEQELKGW